MNKPNVLIIGGPTAVGKTKVSIELARRLGGEIIGADSMQIYKYMDIGTAKPTKEEMAEIPHHLIDFVHPSVEFSVSDFRRLALEKIDEILSRGNLPIVVGGTGLYLNSLLYEMDFAKAPANREYREKLDEMLLENGPEYMHNMLREVDPASAETIHFNNTRRVLRALEVFHVTGKPKKNFSKDLVLNEDYNFCFIGLNDIRSNIYDRINGRVEIMLKEGLLEEVKSLKNMNLDDNITSLQGIGYKEVIEFLNDKCSLEECIDKIKQNSRKYAKRQITWLKRYKFVKWFDISEFETFENLFDEAENYIRESF
jgi:tRNA dimethylallyltransferase